MLLFHFSLVVSFSVGFQMTVVKRRSVESVSLLTPSWKSSSHLLTSWLLSFLLKKTIPSYLYIPWNCSYIAQLANVINKSILPSEYMSSIPNAAEVNDASWNQNWNRIRRCGTYGNCCWKGRGEEYHTRVPALTGTCLGEYFYWFTLANCAM